jgi:hypothetical protein
VIEMKFELFTALGCMLTFIPHIQAQQKPDFSGEWILNKDKSHLELKILKKLEKAMAKIEHRDPVFKLSRVFIIEGEDNSLTLELISDGIEKSSQEGNQTHHSRLYWEGKMLVFVTRIVAPQGEATNTVRYQLLENGRILKAEEKFRGPRLEYDNVWVFEKQEKHGKTNRDWMIEDDR